ncbi:hypothetical protein RN001_005593 [Aquatica leii]|uniref:Uncharacterized protein n=1 Tax=Aquatica leii TaxID=1421715 RepID=A0AAN7Q0J4_9COLE|nr:hypothetical protein RN001_005593 [Aquatica leii]
MVFNRRRSGELERITIKDCSVLKFADSALSLSGHLTNPEEVRLARKYKRFEIRGKLNRTVPVLVEFDTEACINLIIEKREEVGISSENPYVFARPSTDHRHKYLRAYILLRTYANLCGATRPDLIRATLLRKQIATECALNDLADNQIRDVANFMGHAIDIHNNIYRRPIEKRDIIQMSQILEKIQYHDDSEMIEEQITSDLNLDNNTLNLSSSVPINQQETNETALQMLDEPNQSEDSDVSSDSDSEEYTPKPKTKRKHIEGLNRVCGAKRPWTNPEKMAVIKNFEEYIKEDRLPSMDQLLIKLAPLVELKNRSPTSVRSWIQNELQRRRSNGQKTVLKSRWTPSIKMELKTVFRDHFEDSTLPSILNALLP